MLMKADIEVTGSEKNFYRYNILNNFMRQKFFQNDIFLVIQIFANSHIGVELIVYHKKLFVYCTD